MDITLRQMRYFVTLAQTGHFGRAAEKCHISQPALSVQIKELEMRLGAELIERGRDGVRPTITGRMVLSRAQEILRQTDALIADTRRAKGMGGQLRLGIIPTIAPYLLPAALPLLRDAFPELELRVLEAQTETLLQQLRNAELDLVVAAMPNHDPTLQEILLFEDAFVLAYGASNHWPLPDTPQDILPEALLLLDDGHCLADQALLACGMTREKASVDLRAAGLSSLARFAATGAGLTLLPHLSLEAEMLAAPQLRLQAFDKPPSRLVGLIMREGTAEMARVEAVADILREQGEALCEKGQQFLALRG